MGIHVNARDASVLARNQRADYQQIGSEDTSGGFLCGRSRWPRRRIAAAVAAFAQAQESRECRMDGSAVNRTGAIRLQQPMRLLQRSPSILLCREGAEVKLANRKTIVAPERLAADASGLVTSSRSPNSSSSESGPRTINRPRGGPDGPGSLPTSVLELEHTVPDSPGTVGCGELRRGGLDARLRLARFGTSPDLRCGPPADRTEARSRLP